MTEQSIIAFLPRHPTSWAKMIELAMIIAQDGGYKPVMLLTTPSMALMAPIAKRYGVSCVDISENIKFALEKGAAPWGNRFAGEAMCERSAFLPGAWLRAWGMSRSLAIWRTTIQNALVKLQPFVMMVPGDRELEPVAPTLAACVNLGIKTIICTSNVPNIGALKLSRQGGQDFRCGSSAPLLNRLAAWKYPKQANDADGELMLFSPGWRVFSLARQNMISSNPWVQGGGLADYTLHANKPRLKTAIQQGLDPNKAVFVGDHTLDPLYRAFQASNQIRSKLYEEFKFSPDKKLVIVSVPNDAEHGLCEMDTHLGRLENWLAPLHRTGHHIILSLHPKSEQSNYQNIADRYNFYFSSLKLSNILPAADLFICSCSSTIFWAQLCAIPVINMDYLLYRSPHFDAPVGVHTAETPEEFENCLDQFDAGEINNGLLEFSKTVKFESLFDGQAGRRICDFLDTLNGDAQ